MEAPTTIPPRKASHPADGLLAALLVAGVGISALVLFIGLVLVAVTGQTGYHEDITPALILARQGTVAFPTTFGGVWQGVITLKPFAVIELGALLLVATPVFRVAASVVLFFLEKDAIYTIVTLAVLALLLISLFWLR
ncbi:MAG: DUF1634 domain-containing protein [Bacteroidetes bacterium]|nr:DUF1634 domain-containing protein [Bacteroidota bacterium]MCL5026897.1 DUF1634 domain-containing protein [Chloroflexota bacterium]